jgi:membrane-bound metal-dependent hydrolase YbcI (DUF457 family)
MPSSVVHAAVALLLAVGLLGRFYDRRALAILFGIVVFPELDSLAGWVVAGAHRTLLHTLVIPAVASAGFYWETTREESLLRERLGEYGIRLLWVGLFVHTFAHLALDWVHLEGINGLWPLRDQFFRLEGELSLSTTEGFVQTFVEIAEDAETGEQTIDVGGGESRRETHVDNPAQPTADPDPDEPIDRRFPIAVRGWQLYLVCVGLATAVAKRLQSQHPDER